MKRLSTLLYGEPFRNTRNFYNPNGLFSPRMRCFKRGLCRLRGVNAPRIVANGTSETYRCKYAPFAEQNARFPLGPLRRALAIGLSWVSLYGIQRCWLTLWLTKGTPSEGSRTSTAGSISWSFLSLSWRLSSPVALSWSRVGSMLSPWETCRVPLPPSKRNEAPEIFPRGRVPTCYLSCRPIGKGGGGYLGSF